MFTGGTSNLPMARKIWPRLTGKKVSSVRRRRKRRTKRRKGKTGPGSLIGRLVAEALRMIAEEEICKTPGRRIRSKGKGRGKARGRGRGPMGVPAGDK